MKISKQLRYGAVTIVALLSIGLFTSSTEDPKFKLGKDIEILINSFRDLSLFYVDEIDSDKMLKDAIDGITSSLDPYTEFIPASEMAMFEVMTTGKYGGIGSVIRQKGDYVVIDQPYKGFPADKAGLKSGDKIVEIDGKDMKGVATEMVSKLMKGDPGSKFKLKVEKFLTGKVEDIVMQRERIAISGLPYYGFVSDGIGYIEHDDFTEGCADDMRRAVMAMEKDGQLKGLVIDLRNNGGGILQEAVKILSLFVPKGTEVVSMKGRVKQTESIFKTETEPLNLNVPIVVLTDRGSASASEIVAGAFQDLDRGVLMGQRTFGKGLVQSPRPVGYDAYMKITTARYYVPSGRFIQALDYSHKAEDGSVKSVPDSLIKEYKTRGGRKVYDGGGIMPDVKLEPEYISRFAAIAYTRNYITEFVDDYSLRNRDSVDLKTFKLSNGEYQKFIAFMQDKDMDYQSRTQTALESLREKAEEEKFLPQIKEQLDAIQKLIKDDKGAGWNMFQDDLRAMIEDQIIVRQYYAQGVIERRASVDKSVAQAVKLLNNTEEYNKILTSKDTDRK